jgi:hypothetical protein
VVRVWVIRGGDDNRLVDEFIDNDSIGVGYYRVRDGTRISEDELTAILRNENLAAAGQRLSRFRWFVWQMSPGDVVVMPDTPRGEVVIGEIVGDYEYRADLPADRYRHRRAVKWLGRHPHSDLPAGREDVYRQRQTLQPLDAPDIIKHANRVRRGEVGRRATDRRGLTKRKRAVTARRSGNVTGAAAADKVCPGCGQLRAPTQLAAHGGRCADCALDA